MLSELEYECLMFNRVCRSSPVFFVIAVKCGLSGRSWRFVNESNSTLTANELSIPYWCPARLSVCSSYPMVYEDFLSKDQEWQMRMVPA